MKYLILDKILQGIRSGTYAGGDKLPSENRLTEKYYVTRIEAREALKTLEDMGFIYSEKGKGRFMRHQQAKIPLNLNGSESFSEKLRAAGMQMETFTVSKELISFNEHIYSILKASEDETIHCIERLRVIQQKPVAIHFSYLRESMFPDLASEGDAIQSLFSYFRSKGCSSFTSSRSSISVILPTYDEQNLLGCPPLVPLLKVESDTIDQETESVLQYTEILYRSDSFQYLID